MPVGRPPHPEDPIRAPGGDPASVGAEGRGDDLTRVLFVRRFHFPARRRVPLADGPIRRRRHEAPAIWAECDAEHLARVPSTFGAQPRR